MTTWILKNEKNKNYWNFLDRPRFWMKWITFLLERQKYVTVSCFTFTDNLSMLSGFNCDKRAISSRTFTVVLGVFLSVSSTDIFTSSIFFLYWNSMRTNYLFSISNYFFTISENWLKATWQTNLSERKWGRAKETRQDFFIWFCLNA